MPGRGARGLVGSRLAVLSVLDCALKASGLLQVLVSAVEADRLFQGFILVWLCPWVLVHVFLSSALGVRYIFE